LKQISAVKNIFVIFILHLQAFGQETPVSDSLENSNPVIFAEIFAGLGGSGAGMSFMWNGSGFMIVCHNLY
jgi:hypothetical protein